MKNFNLNELNLNNLAIWPLPIKLSVIISSCLLILILGYWFDSSIQLAKLNKAEQQAEKLRLDFKNKAAQAGNLPAYQQQLIQMQKILTTLVHQLPNSTEIPSLLEDISKIGIANGLRFQLFKPLPEQHGNFFIQLPIQISVIGNYHQLSLFVSQLAQLNRIVILQDFNVEPYKAEKSMESIELADERLMMNVTAETYRYPDALTHNQ